MISLQNLTDTEIIEQIPELQELAGVVENNPWHKNDDVLVHTMTVFNRLKENLKLFAAKTGSCLSQQVGDLTRKDTLLWAALFHDIAKPDTFQQLENRTMCPNHEAAGAEKAAKILEKYIANIADRGRIVDIIEFHNAPHDLLSEKSPDLFDQKFKDYQARLPKFWLELLLMGLSDTESAQLEVLIPDEYTYRTQKYYQLFDQMV